MTADRWDRVKEIFNGALARSTGERRAWLEGVCADDEAIRREVESLLDAYDADPAFLESPAEFDPEDIAAALDPPADPAILPPGTRLGDSQYRIIGEAGRGGMAVVYIAEDLRLPRRVALKSLRGIGTADASRVERFRREAWAAARISHPCVATVYAFEQFPEGAFIVYELVRGRTLRDEMRQGPIAAPRATRMAIDIARALAAAHEQGVIHRDLKPENVMLTTDGHVKVLDFGIAQIDPSMAPALTQQGVWLGTPAYMAPEQREGRTVDARADIYSFGIVLSEMVTGRHPVGTPASGGTAPDGSIDRSAAAAPHLIAVARRCLHLDPADRYATARELLADLEREAASGENRAASAIWWWEFHQVAAALLYCLMIAAAWEARDSIQAALGDGARGTRVASAFFLATLASVTVSSALRLNLWFTSRQLPVQLSDIRRRMRPWVRGGDWAFIATLATGGFLIIEHAPNRSFLLFGAAIGAAVASAFIEPVTTRAAFGSGSGERRG